MASLTACVASPRSWRPGAGPRRSASRSCSTANSRWNEPGGAAAVLPHLPVIVAGCGKTKPSASYRPPRSRADLPTDLAQMPPPCWAAMSSSWWTAWRTTPLAIERKSPRVSGNGRIDSLTAHVRGASTRVRQPADGLRLSGSPRPRHHQLSRDDRSAGGSRPQRRPLHGDLHDSLGRTSGQGAARERT